MATWTRFRVVLVLALLGSGVVVAACGGEESGSNSSSGQSSDEAMRRAKAAIEPFVGQPSPFPRRDPLEKRPPAGTTLTYVDCGSPVCALFRQLLGPAAETMGVELTVVKADGASTQSIQAAFNSVADSDTDGVISAAIDPALWGPGLDRLKAKKVPIAVSGVVNGAEYGLTEQPNSVSGWGVEATKRNGKLLADWIYVKHGADTNAVYYSTPEIAFSEVMSDAFQNELNELCPDCPFRSVKIPIATLGNTAPQRIVSDLQSHPDTNAATAFNSEVFNGLPAALSTAGIEVDLVGDGGGPTNLQYVKDGQQTVDYAMDMPILVWGMVDALIRPIVGQPAPRDSAENVVQQFLEQDDITFDPSNGWTGYPDFAERFAELWQAESD